MAKIVMELCREEGKINTGWLVRKGPIAEVTLELALEGRLGTNILRREKEDSMQKKQHNEPESREATVCSVRSVFPGSHSIN